MDQTGIQNKIKNARHALVLLPMALGDFTYWQLVLRAFAEQYPQLRLDLMPDEYFINTRFHRGSGALVNPIICDWAAQTGVFHDVYADLYTGDSEAALARAKKVGYDVVFVMSSRGRSRKRRARYSRKRRLSHGRYASAGLSSARIGDGLQRPSILSCRKIRNDSKKLFKIIITFSKRRRGCRRTIGRSGQS